MNQDQHLMDAYKEYSKSLNIQMDLTQTLQQKISDTKHRFKLKLKPAYVLAIIAAFVVITGFTLLMTQNIDLKTGKVTRETQGNHLVIGSEETSGKLKSIAQAIESNIPKGQYAVITIEEANGSVSTTVETTSTSQNPREIKDESTFRRLCKESEISLPTLSSYDGIKYAYGYLDTDEPPRPEKVEKYDENTTISYFSSMTNFSNIKQFYCADGYYATSQKETIWVSARLYKNMEEIKGGFSDSTQITNVNVSGWSYAVCAEETQSTDDPHSFKNAVVLGKEIDNTTYITVSIHSQTTPVQELLDIASNIN